ncbi:MAG: J domain-containing protein [Candidatus Obscuribacterales bacterium]|nr:J domain-containing protein [Candidatus Obscuribacterales bacterium]
MNKTTASFEDCYKILELEFGANWQTINKQWRKLSILYHPDRHYQNRSAHAEALEKQKQINNARDKLKNWFEQYPSLSPPGVKAPESRTERTTEAGKSKNNTASKNSSTNNHHENRHAKDTYHEYKRYQKKHDKSKQSPNGKTQVFSPPPISLSGLQKLTLRIEKLVASNDGHPNMISVVFLTICLPITVFLSTSWMELFVAKGTNFHDPACSLAILAGLVLGSAVLNWYYTEIELLGLMRKIHLYRSSKSASELQIFFEILIQKHNQQKAKWLFQRSGNQNTARLNFEEAAIPGYLDAAREIEITYQVQNQYFGSELAFAIRCKSPVHSHTCLRLLKLLLEDLKLSRI